MCTTRKVAKNTTVYPAPDRRISITGLTERGGAILHPRPSELRNQCPDLKIQMALDRAGKVIEGNLTLLTSGSWITAQVRAKSKCLTIWLSVFVGHYSNVSNINRSIQQHGSCVGHFNYHPKLSATISMVKVIQGHEVKDSSN